MSLIIAIIFFIISTSGILTNTSIIILVLLTKQLNSPNRILLLHLSIICLSLSILYLWILINNSITIKFASSTTTLPNIATTTTATVAVTTSTNNLLSSSTLSSSIRQMNSIYKYLDKTGLTSETLTIISNNESSTLSSITPTTTPLSQESSEEANKTEDHSICSVNDLFINILQPLSIWTICCLNFDRFYAICSPLHYNTLFTTKKVTTFLCCSYLVVLVTVFPVYLMIWITTSEGDRMIIACWFKSVNIRVSHGESQLYNNNHSFEAHTAEDNFYWWEVHILLSTILTIFLPITLIVICNIKVLTIASYQRHRIASAIFEATLSAQVAITHQKNPFLVPNLLNQSFFFAPKPNVLELKKKSQKAVLVVFELIVSIIVMYCPYYLFMICFSFYMKHKSMNYDSKDQQLHLIENVLNIIIVIVQFLLICSPTINAILYGLKNKTIQENIQHFWRKQKTKIELHYEIQARTPSTCGSRKNSITETTNIPNQQPLLRRHLSDFFFSDNCNRELHKNYLSQNIEPIGRSSSRLSIFNSFKKYLPGSRNNVGDDDDMNHDREFPKILITKYSVSIQSNQSISLRRESTQQTTITCPQDAADQHEIERLLTCSQSLTDLSSSEKSENRYQTL